MAVKMRIAVLALAVCLLAAPALAGNWYMGGGFEIVELGDDLGQGVDTGTGFVLNFGYRYNPNFALDFLWGTSVHSDDYIVDDFWYGRFSAGANFILFPVGPTQPYVTVGFAAHSIEYDLAPYQVTGNSLFVGGGVDLYLDQRNSFDVGIRIHQWDADWEDYLGPLGSMDATTTVISVCYNYHFLL